MGRLGFTLVELIVVISIVGILLLFSLPLFSGVNFFSDSKGSVGDIVRLINDIKKRAVEQNIDFKLHIDKNSNRLWITNASMDDEANNNAEAKGVQLPKNLSILDVQFPGFHATDDQEYQIRFANHGYSDFVLIHLTEGGQNVTLKIEPFLSRVQFIDSHIYLDDCI